AGTSTAEAMTNRVADDDYFRTASGVAPTPPTFLGNHDMGRAAEQIQSRSNAAGDALLAQALLGYDLLYLLRGAPVVYYGDEVGMIGMGGDQQSRQDMFPTQVQDWQQQDRVGSPPIGKASSFDVTNNPIEARLRELGALRDAHAELATGSTIVRQAQGKTLVVSRIANQHELVAAFNSGTTPAHISVKVAEAETVFSPVFGTLTPASSAADGTLELDVSPISAVLYSAVGNFTY